MKPTDIDNLRILITHPDKAHQQQGWNLLESFGREGFKAVFNEMRWTNTIPGPGKRRPHRPYFCDWLPDRFVNSELLSFFFDHHSASLPEIRDLDLGGFNIFHLDFLRGMQNLWWLNCNSCTGLQDIGGIADLEKLEHLEFFSCDSLDNIEACATIPRLLYLNINHCKLLNDSALLSLRGHPKLVEINGEMLPVVEPRCFSDMPRLIRLNLTFCKDLQSVAGLQNLPRLRELCLEDCTVLRNLDGLGALPMLTDLNLYRCEELQNVDGLSQCTALERVNIGTYGGYEPDWDEYMYGPHALTSIEGLLGLKRLVQVSTKDQAKLPESQAKVLLEMLIRNQARVTIEGQGEVEEPQK